MPKRGKASTNGNHTGAAKNEKTQAGKEKNTTAPDFKVDRSPSARAFARAVRITHERLYGAKKSA